MFDARRVAYEFVRLAEQDENTLTPMQLLKLVYIAHGYSLGFLSTPLISNQVEAWKYGPVIRDLYDAIRHRRDKPVQKSDLENFIKDPESFNPRQNEVIQSVYDVYGKQDGIQLSYLTHKDGTPWKQVFKEDQLSIPIGDDLIEHHYKNIIKSAESSKDC